MRPLEMALNRQYTPTDTATKSAHSAITIHRVISFFPDFFSETDFVFLFSDETTQTFYPKILFRRHRMHNNAALRSHIRVKDNTKYLSPYFSKGKIICRHPEKRVILPLAEKI